MNFMSLKNLDMTITKEIAKCHSSYLKLVADEKTLGFKE